MASDAKSRATHEVVATTRISPVRDGILVLTGYGLDIRVERGQLQVRDGVGRHRREGLLHRATSGLNRLVVLGHTGAITLDAIRWLADIGAAFVQIDENARVLAAFGPVGTDRPALRRAQARAADSPLGISITQRLLMAKLRGQADTLRVLGGAIEVDAAAIHSIDGLTEAIELTFDVSGLRLIEARAARAYWGAWSAVPVRFARRDAAHVPDHWRVFGARTSPLTSSPRLAANPANALLNYLYAVLEAEAIIAARVIGLDPGLGVMHADQLNRASLAADLMEPIRPAVDRYVFELLARRTFTARDFFETREGVCRVTAPLAAELAATGPRWRSLVGQVTEDVARMLAGEGDGIPTPISGRNRSAGRGLRSKGVRIPPARLTPTCVVCGSPTRRGRMTCSEPCAAAQRQENPNPRFVAAGRTNLARLRDSGWRPQLSEDGRQRLRRGSHERIAAAREWQRSHPWPADMAEFGREIAPLLAAIGPGALQQATGLSPAYLRQIVRGAVVPHPMWWESLRAAAAQAM